MPESFSQSADSAIRFSGMDPRLRGEEAWNMGVALTPEHGSLPPRGRGQLLRAGLG